MKSSIIFGLIVFLLLIFLVIFVGAEDNECRVCELEFRGDSNNDCQIDIADIITISNVRFRGVDEFCNFEDYYEPADVNGDGKVDISDMVYLGNYLFLGGEKPVALRRVPSCTDSDGGLNFGVRGTVEVKSETGTVRVTDWCDGSGLRLTEFFCLNSMESDALILMCSNGCRDGVCIGGF
jgi:hypothetical protein